jgi:hypothetical protein
MLLQAMRFICDELLELGFATAHYSEYKPSHKPELQNYWRLREPRNPRLEILCAKSFQIFGINIPGLVDKCILTIDYDLAEKKCVRYLARTQNPAVEKIIVKAITRFSEATGIECRKLQKRSRLEK